ncbi:host attachment protein [Gluconacetobacter takamatsuzukensis]|uniref:Host attachment protein n=1 Tax=Gluconacetobacter takamatsuzukensis TaxID=1286190 RepID=A0A7W4KFT0_9PROT|nr:host attachment protein [Gluconacetobacter takamatsuzukensis]MBB2206164.1 host attachment protein [Gluconacetobacter takamatsuzukensis]
MTARHGILIVVADGEHARFVQPADNHALHTIASFDALTAHQRTSDLGDDAPGATYHTGSTAHHALNPRHDRHGLEMASFAKFVARQIDAWDQPYERLLLIAPAHSSSGIASHLKAGTKAKIIGIIGKDLTRTPDNALKDHIEYNI